MPTFQTIYRAVVMVAVGLFAVKGWQLYGPSGEQLRSFALRMLEAGQTALRDTAQEEPLDPQDPRPPLAIDDTATPVAPEPAPLFATPEGSEDASTAGRDNSPQVAAFELTAAPEAEIEPAVVPAAAAGEGGELPALYARLKELGGADPQLSEWGSSGEFFRFRCRARDADTAAYARHFEAVAREPQEAVEQVVAKVAAWRAERAGEVR